jgi:nucleoside 2-deoxyribosyltransferase
MKIYLAGPDVFRPDADAWAVSARELCRRYGFDPLLPLDHGETAPERIFAANIGMIREAQVVAANLDPFRGPEPDSGTSFELGYALALGKRTCGYVSRLDSVARRVAAAQGCDELPTGRGGRMTDRDGMFIENFDLPCNLMLAIPVPIVAGGLEACLQSLRGRPLSTSPNLDEAMP